MRWTGKGLLLSWTDKSGTEWQWAMPRAMLEADGEAVLRKLEAAGLEVSKDPEARALAIKFFREVRSANRIRAIPTDAPERIGAPVPRDRRRR